MQPERQQTQHAAARRCLSCLATCSAWCAFQNVFSHLLLGLVLFAASWSLAQCSHMSCMHSGHCDVAAMPVQR